MHVNEQQTTHNEQQESCVHVAVVAGEVKWSVASNVLRVDLSTVLKKNHHNLRNRERPSSTSSNKFGFSLVVGGTILSKYTCSGFYQWQGYKYLGNFFLKSPDSTTEDGSVPSYISVVILAGQVQR